MGSELILSFNIDVMLSLDGDFGVDANADLTCEQSFRLFSFFQSICTKNIKDLDDDYEAQICGSYRRGTVPHVSVATLKLQV